MYYLLNNYPLPSVPVPSNIAPCCSQDDLSTTQMIPLFENHQWPRCCPQGKATVPYRRPFVIWSHLTSAPSVAISKPCAPGTPMCHCSLSDSPLLMLLLQLDMPSHPFSICQILPVMSCMAATPPPPQKKIYSARTCECDLDLEKDLFRCNERSLDRSS